MFELTMINNTVLPLDVATTYEKLKKEPYSFGAKRWVSVHYINMERLVATTSCENLKAVISPKWLGAYDTELHNEFTETYSVEVSPRVNHPDDLLQGPCQEQNYPDDMRFTFRYVIQLT